MASASAEVSPVIVIHGGAGVMKPGAFSPEEEGDYRATLAEALETGYAILNDGGKSIDAVEATIRILEDSPLFNAGRGAVFTEDGANELDASLMDGRTLNVGAVAGVKQVKNPITLARVVMERSRHVMFARDGAETFAREQGVETVAPDYFYTQRRWDALEQAKAEAAALVADPDKETALPRDFKFGTVGAVALDRSGDIVAGTSTGGLTMKRWGRVGDSPIIGAGTYADNRSCGVSATGDGEYFIRLTIARDICALVEYQGLSVQAASDRVIQDKLTELGGEGGVIVVGPDGSHAFSFNTPGMFRGVMREGVSKVSIFKDEQEN